MNRPFDAARYAGLLEGLEITELRLSQVMNDNRVSRLDAQYFSKAGLAAVEKIQEGKWDDLLHLSSRVDSFGAYALTNKFAYVENGIPFLRCMNIRNGFADFSDIIYITSEANDLLFKSEVKPGMVLLTMSGSVGNATVALPRWQYPVNSNQDIAKITPKPTVNSYFITAFLASKYGRLQMERLPVGSVQQHIFLWMIERLLVRRFSPELEVMIGQVVARAYELELSTTNGVLDGEKTLLRALGLESWQPPEPLSYVSSSRDAFAAGRLDAEYFAPRVIELLGRLGQHGQCIRDVAPARHERFVAAATGTFDYIEIGNLRADGTAMAEPTEQSDAPSRATWHVHAGDIVTSMVRPIRRLSALIAPEQDGTVCSSGFVVLNPQTVAPEVLLTYLRLPPVCELMDLHTSASLYPAIAETDLLALPFPHIEAPVQAQIVANVRAAQASRRRATDLLDAAKRAVEIAIEDSEAAALQYLASFNLPASTAP